VEKLLSIDMYLKKEKDSLIYTKKSPLSVYVPKYFKERDFLIIREDVEVLGILKLSINNKEGVLIFPTMISMVPDSVDLEDEYYKLVFNQNNVFIKNHNIIKDTSMFYRLFVTFVSLGKVPEYISYENLPYIFDIIQYITSYSLNSRRTVFELMFGELVRNKDNLFERYRNSNMKGEYKSISMHDLVHAGKTVTSKLMGGYFRDGLVASLLIENKDEEASPLESLIRT
jgi:hypothetical protein